MKNIAPKLGIAYRDLDSIKPLEKNFKLHDVEGIAGSIAKRGLLTPIGIDESTGENFDGNGRVEALQLLKSKGGEPPVGVIVKGDKWMVPVTTGITFNNDNDRRAAAAALNRLNERGGYDAELQLEVLQSLQAAGALEETGYDDAYLTELVATMHFEPEPEEGKTSDASDGKGGVKVRETAKMSEMRQTQLAFDPERYSLFLKLSVALSQKLGTTDVSATVFRAMELLADKPHLFDPNIKPPVSDGGEVTASDVAAAEKKQGGKFTGEQNLIPAICPECATEFEVDPKLM